MKPITQRFAWVGLVVALALVGTVAVTPAQAGTPSTFIGWGLNGIALATVPVGVTGDTPLSAGFAHMLALKSDGTVVGWGSNGSGQTTVPAGLSGVTAIAAGYAYSLALKSDGNVVGWGDNGFGQTTVPAGLNGVTAIAAGVQHSLAVKSDGTVVAWGWNGLGQTTVPAGLSGVTAVAAGWSQSLALKSDGTVVAWGSYLYGGPNVLAGLSGVTAIVASWQQSLALKSDGTVAAWGWTCDARTTVPVGLRGVTAIAAGLAHALALKSDGTVAAWGRATSPFCPNRRGQMNVPAGLSGVTAIYAGGDFSLAFGVIAAADGVPPVVTAPADVTAEATSPAGAIGTYPNATATDNIGVTSGPTCLPASGSQFALGPTTVTCTAKDAAGNTGTATFTITVKDTIAPAVICAAADGLWHATDVSIACTATDGGSGLANPADASFSLSTSVPNGTETANASTGSRQVCDNASNCTTAGPIAGNKVDKKAPLAAPAQSPAANGAGLNKADVTVTWNWSDGGSGVDPAACTTSSTSTGEGTITLTATCTDKTGNTGSASYTVKVDKTTPVAYNEFDPATKDVVVNGRDGGSGVASVSCTTAPVKWSDGDDDKDEPGTHHLSDDKGKDDEKAKAELRTCTVTDVAGNTTVLVEKVKKAGNEVKAIMLTVQYNGGAVIALPKNGKKFEWSTTKTGSLKELEQKLTIGQGAGRQNVEAKYEAEKNKTTIEKELPKPETKVTLPGLVLLRLVTDGSGLKIEY